MIGFIEIQIIIALVALAYAGLYDLKTTDIPDISPYTMAIAGVIINGIHSYVTGNYSYILWSLGLGLGFFGFGFLLYYTKQWGGGDAKLLSGLGFILPTAPVQLNSLVPYPLVLLMNIFLVGAVYSIFYALVASLRTPGFVSTLVDDIKSNKGRMSIFFVIIVSAMFLFSVLMAFFTNKIHLLSEVLLMQSFLIPGIIFLLILWRFIKIVDTQVFKKEISTKDLKEGDVLVDDVKVGKKKLKAGLIEGLTKEQVKLIKKHHKKIRVLDAIRFGPVFFLALVVTLLGFSIF